MSIAIYDSRTVRQNSTAQDILNDLADKWDGWYDIVYDTTVTTNVTQLWASEYIYITKDNSSTPKLKVVHTNGATYTQAGSTLTAYYIVTTDNAVLLKSSATGANAQFIAVGATVDPNDTASKGVIADLSTSSACNMFTDNMLTSAQTHTFSNTFNNASVNTVLIDAYSIGGDEHFTDIKYVWQCKESDAGKVTMSNQKYYIYAEVALPYA